MTFKENQKQEYEKGYEAKGVVNPAIIVLPEGYEPEDLVQDIIDASSSEHKPIN